MRKNGRAWPLFVALLFTAPEGRAASGPGTTAANFLNIGVGARAAALGQTFTGVADDVDAIFYNPAGLGLLPRQELTFMHNEFFPGVHQEWAAYALPTEELGTFAASADLLITDPFPSFDQFDSPAGNISARDEAYELAYAKSWEGRFSVGAGAKFIRSRLDDQSAQTQAADFGAFYKLGDSWGLGASILNLGPGMKFLAESFALPLAFKAGVSWRPLGPEVKDRSLVVAADVTLPRWRGPGFSGGVEYLAYDALVFRAGGVSNQDAGPGYSLGMGIHLHRLETKRAEIDFDYAFVDYGEVASATHRASITLKFGPSVAFLAYQSTYKAAAPARPAPEEAAPQRTPREERRPAAREKTIYEKAAEPQPAGTDDILVNP